MLKLGVRGRSGQLSRPDIMIDGRVLRVLNATSEYVTNGLQGCKGIHHVDCAALFARQLHLEVAHNHQIVLIDDLYKLRINFGADVLALDLHNGRPGFMYGSEDHLEHDVDNPGLGRSEHPARGQPLDTTSKPAKKVIQRGEDHVGVNDHHRRAA